MESTPGQRREGGNVIPLPIREDADMGLRELEQAVVEALTKLTDANSKDEPASVEASDIGAKLTRAKSDEEKRELTTQLDAAHQRRYKVWDEIREARTRYAEAEAAYKTAKEGLKKFEEEPAEHRKAA